MLNINTAFFTEKNLTSNDKFIISGGFSASFTRSNMSNFSLEGSALERSAGLWFGFSRSVPRFYQQPFFDTWSIGPIGQSWGFSEWHTNTIPISNKIYYKDLFK